MSTTPLHAISADGHVLAERRGAIGLITLNRPGALNALSLAMVRDLTQVLLDWRSDPTVAGVAVRGAGREGKPPAFCAGGDIRFFHQAALAGDPRLEDFFTEEYALNHLIHRYPKPYVALMDGICMGGGMGISQGAALRVVTEHSKLAMPETQIGLFPDVSGGWFLARCPGHLGEYLALTGHVLGAEDAIAAGLADIRVEAARQDELVAALSSLQNPTADGLLAAARHFATPVGAAPLDAHRAEIDACFSRDSLVAIDAALQAAGGAFAHATRQALAKRSPLMMAVTLEQVRRARQMTLAEDLRLERNLVRHCFWLRPGTASETVEGIRALAVDKDHAPRWNPPHIADVRPEQLAPFFASPWPPHVHPLRALD